MKRGLVLAVCFIVMISHPVMAQENPTEVWTQEIAQLLMSPEWEIFARNTDGPLIGYALRFIEIDGSFIERYEGELVWETAGEGAPWAISYDPTVLKVLGGTASAVEFTWKGLAAENFSATQSDSWLMTVLERPLTILLKEHVVGSRAEDDLYFHLRLTPLNIDYENQRVETNISLDHVSSTLSLGKVSVTSLVSPNPTNPVAILSRSVAAGSTNRRQYLALYVAGMPIPSDMLPANTGIVPIGNILGLHELFALHTDSIQPPGEWIVALDYGNQKWGYSLSLFYPFGEKHRMTGYLRYEESPEYLVGYELGIYEDLGLMLQIEGEGTRGAFRMGFKDELQWTPHLAIALAFLPVELDFSERELGFANYWGVHARYDLKNWRLDYRGRFNGSQLDHKVGLSLFTEAKIGVDMSWSRTFRGDQRVAAGLAFRNF